MKMSILRLVKTFSFVVVTSLVQVAVGQTTDTQTFTVTVPSSLSIIAPEDRFLTHDTTDNGQVFEPGTDTANHWAVLCNAAAGATVNLTTLTPFTHTTNSNYQRDAQLDLAVSSSDNAGGSAVWTVTNATDVTDYLGSDDNASVQAVSSAPGKATLALTVTFVTDTYSTLLQGDYQIDVVGTIAAN